MQLSSGIDSGVHLGSLSAWLIQGVRGVEKVYCQVLTDGFFLILQSIVYQNKVELFSQVFQKGVFLQTPG